MLVYQRVSGIFWNEYQLGIFIESNIMEDWKL